MRPALALFLLAACLGFADSANAESKMLLKLPATLEDVSATTYDEQGQEIGRSSFEVERTESGAHRMKIELAVAGGGVNYSEATLAAVEENSSGSPLEAASPLLRLTEQRSQATRADGVQLDLLVVDHLRRRASCYRDGVESASGKHLEIPSDDRVVNVPLQLLFQPLAVGEVNSIRFQLALCRKGPVLQDMVAVRGSRTDREGRDVIEIHYGPDFGDAVAWLASRVMPRFSFWFGAQDGGYLGHRMPLHRKGPEILLVRQGLTPPDLGLPSR